MSDQQQPADEPVIADTSTETGNPPTQQEIDWAKRYSDLQPEYTRVSQEAAQYRQATQDLQSDDADTRIAAAQHLGLDPALFVEYEEDPTDDTPYLTREEFKAFQAEQAQAAEARAKEEQQQAFVQKAESFMDSEMKRLQVPEHVKRLIVADALAQPANEQGLPNIEAAFNYWQNEVRTAEQKAWRDTKRTGFVSPGGQQATHVPDLNNDEERLRWMNQRWADLSQ